MTGASITGSRRFQDGEAMPCARDVARKGRVAFRRHARPPTPFEDEPPPRETFRKPFEIAGVAAQRFVAHDGWAIAATSPCRP